MAAGMDLSRECQSEGESDDCIVCLSEAEFQSLIESLATSRAAAPRQS
jgi:hypothetical protein